MLLAITATSQNDRGPRFAEQFFSAIHQGNPGRHALQLEFGRHEQTVGLYVRIPSELKAVVTSQLAAQYPHVHQQRIKEESTQANTERVAWFTDLHLRPDCFPLRRYGEFENKTERTFHDPLAGLLAAISPGTDDTLHCRISLRIQPAHRWRRWWYRRLLNRLAHPFFQKHSFLLELYSSAACGGLASRMATWPVTWLMPGDHRSPHGEGTTMEHDRESNLAAAADKLGGHLWQVQLRLSVEAPSESRRHAKRKLRELAGAFGQFTSPRLATFHAMRPKRRHASSIRGRRFLLSSEELATLWHPATASVRAPKMETHNSREFEPPVHLPRAGEEGIAILGETAFRNRRERFGIRTIDRRRHLAIVGKTGMGKSTLLENLLVADMRAGRGVGVIDPHGNLAEAVLAAVPTHRTNDVVLFDASDRQHPPAYNPLTCNEPSQWPLVAAAVLSAFKKLFGDSWGPRLENVLRNTLLALVETPNATLASINDLLCDQAYRSRVVARLQNEQVRSFFQQRFDTWNDRYRQEAIEPVLNKVGQFLSSEIMANIFCQPDGKIDFRRIMDQQQILIVNLSKGLIGEDNSSLLGSLIVSDLQQKAMSRADVPEGDRADFFLTIDEFQNFATDAFATILSEARKYRLNLTLANQYLTQMDEATQDAVFGNIGSLLSFQVGTKDAEVIAGELAGDVLADDLVHLPQYTAYVRLLIGGMPSKPFSMRTLLPKRRPSRERREVIRRCSRSRYSRPTLKSQDEGSEAASSLCSAILFVLGIEE